MTEYTTSSQAYREYMSAHDRTAYWDDCYSPNIPPSVLDGLADSSYSTPPKMVLRYNDGRPDVPIPHPGSGYSSLSRSQTLSYNHPQGRTRSGSSGESPLSHSSHSHRRGHEPRSPEEIRILPSFGGQVPTSSTSSRPNHSRSKSLPRTTDLRRSPEPEVPFIPPSHMQTQSPYHPAQAPLSSPPHQVSFAQAPWHPPRQGHNKHAPPAIVYAPSHHTHRPHYAPPPMYHHPPQMGPNGMIYSHSAPVPGQYPPTYPTPYPSVGGASSHRHTASVQDVRPRYNGAAGSRSLGRSTRINPSSSQTSLNSQQSGSTYYVLPAHGQKVHVIAPSPDQSIVTATSTTKSPTSPYAQTFGRKPFFQRLFGFAKFSSAGSSRGSSNGRKLHRRHSLGASSRHRVDEQGQ
ncbi:hypothetical protein B0H34DRAFT_781293 [Crassisporium funariophilum]|nr:hypothetical protein B0H34DRAFT_781293 [Crassisporium funariophilum]